MSFPEFDKEIRIFKNTMSKIENNLEIIEAQKNLALKLTENLSKEESKFSKALEMLSSSLSSTTDKYNEMMSEHERTLNNVSKMHVDNLNSNYDKYLLNVTKEAEKIDKEFLHLRETLNRVVETINDRLIELDKSKIEFETNITTKEVVLREIQDETVNKMDKFEMKINDHIKQNSRNNNILYLILVLLIILSIVGLFI